MPRIIFQILGALAAMAGGGFLSWYLADALVNLFF